MKIYNDKVTLHGIIFTLNLTKIRPAVGETCERRNRSALNWTILCTSRKERGIMHESVVAKLINF
jgi:hypothetical protein